MLGLDEVTRAWNAITENAVSFIMFAVYVWSTLYVSCMMSEGSCVLVADKRHMSASEYNDEVAFWILTMVVSIVWAVLSIFTDDTSHDTDNYIVIVLIQRHCKTLYEALMASNRSPYQSPGRSL